MQSRQTNLSTRSTNFVVSPMQTRQTNFLAIRSTNFVVSQMQTWQTNFTIRSTSFVPSQMQTRQTLSKKRASISFLQWYGGLSKEEEDQKLNASDRQEKFESMILGYLGEQTLEKPTPPIPGHVSRSSFSLHFSVTDSSVGSTDGLTASTKRFSVNEEEIVVESLPSLDVCQIRACLVVLLTNWQPLWRGFLWMRRTSWWISFPPLMRVSQFRARTSCMRVNTTLIILTKEKTRVDGGY